MALLAYGGRSTEDANVGTVPRRDEEMPGAARFWLVLDARPNASRLGRLGPWPAEVSTGTGGTVEGSGGGISVV